MKPKFKQNKIQQGNNIKVSGNGYHTLKPLFSFANYIHSDEYFSEEHSKEKRNSLYNFFQCIKKFSCITWGEMVKSKHIYHFHSFDEDLSILNDYQGYDLAQFKIPGQKQGRYIGFFDNDNIFHILIYDSQHMADPRK